jgi:hypothetical protein
VLEPVGDALMYDTWRPGARVPGFGMTMTPITLSEAMQDADFVQLNGIVFEAGYLRAPDESTLADDVVMELRHGETELAFTREDLDDAHYVGKGLYRLKSGALLCFLTTATVH